MYIKNIYCKYRLIFLYQIKNINEKRALKNMDGCFFIKYHEAQLKKRQQPNSRYWGN